MGLFTTQKRCLKCNKEILKSSSRTHLSSNSNVHIQIKNFTTFCKMVTIWVSETFSKLKYRMHTLIPKKTNAVLMNAKQHRNSTASLETHTQWAHVNVADDSHQTLQRVWSDFVWWIYGLWIYGRTNTEKTIDEKEEETDSILVILRWKVIESTYICWLHSFFFLFLRLALWCRQSASNIFIYNSVYIHFVPTSKI